MATAREIATELRRIADVLDSNPETNIIKPDLLFYHGYGASKDDFIRLAQIFPRPYKKSDGFSHDEIVLTHENASLEVRATIDKSKVCTIKIPARPAVYDCEPLLSLEEEESLTA